MTTRMIPVAQPVIHEDDIHEVVATLRAGWVSSRGPAVAEFESAFAAYCGRRHGVAVSSGTAALELALACLRLPSGSEIILPNFTMISAATAVVRNGLKPVPIDADPDHWCLDVTKLRSRITSRTRAILAAHVYGHPTHMEPLQEVADEFGLNIIEDAAEAHGARCRYRGPWKMCGSFGQASCFSFYGNKLVSTGEGGMLVTDDPVLAEHARSLRSMAFGAQQHFKHDELGYTYRMSSMQAALGLPQVKRLDQLIESRRKLAGLYQRHLKDLPLKFQREAVWARSCWWVFGVLLDDNAGIDAHEFARRLVDQGVETRPFFTGLHQQPALREYIAPGPYAVSERLGRMGLYLPSGVSLTSGQVEEVCAAVKRSLSAG